MPVPPLADIEAARARIAPYVVQTPVHPWHDPEGAPFTAGPDLWVKLEFLQRTGSFKARGAVNSLLTLDEEAKRTGVVAVSAGNHAIAVSYAAAAAGVSAKVVMHRAANPARVEKAQRYGAEVILADDIPAAFETVRRIQDTEGRHLVHPFEGRRTVEGQATCGLELARQIPELDAVVIAVGGGGLIAGAGASIKAVQPSCRVIGVEPAGAPGLTRSLERGAPLERVDPDTIADSMGAPMHTQGTFEIAREVVDRMVLVDDDTMCRGLAALFDGLKLALEPAGAASVAALMAPLAGEFDGRRVAALLCGSNIDAESYGRLLRRGLGQTA